MIFVQLFISVPRNRYGYGTSTLFEKEVYLEHPNEIYLNDIGNILTFFTVNEKNNKHEIKSKKIIS